MSFLSSFVDKIRNVGEEARDVAISGTRILSNVANNVRQKATDDQSVVSQFFRPSTFIETREQFGNLPGWRQTRKLFIPTPEEARIQGMVSIGDVYIGADVASLEKVGSRVIKNVASKATPKIFTGFKDLTTRFLEYAKGKTILSKQEIADFARRPELKKGEADLLNKLVKDLPEGKLSAQEFADSLRRDLLELKPVKVKEPQYGNTTIQRREEQGRNIITPSHIPPKNYEEVVFESPIATNGSSHYPNSKKYFAHARGDEVVEGGKKIWREQEIQSDLLQKEGLERARALGLSRAESRQALGGDKAKMDEIIKRSAQRGEEINKLEPFTNDRFGERIMRERIKEKASKGYEKYRLPTGETIGKIEGFGGESWRFRPNPADDTLDVVLTASDIKVGREIAQPGGSEFIITDILGDGRFKAVIKDALTENEIVLLSKGEETIQEIAHRGRIIPQSETFDLTGKSNPQYRRYSDWGKFLKNKYGGKEVIDPQGNSWMEIDLKKEQGKLTVEAFGFSTIGTTLGLAGIAGLDVLRRVVNNTKNTIVVDNNKTDGAIAMDHSKDVNEGDFVAGYNIKEGWRAANPEHTEKVRQIYNQIVSSGPNSPETLQKDIDRVSGLKKKDSPLNGQMIFDIAIANGIDPRILAAAARQDSSYGIEGKAVKTKNATNAGTFGKRVQPADSWEEGLEFAANILFSIR